MLEKYIPEAIRTHVFGALAALTIVIGTVLDASGYNINVAEILTSASPFIGGQILVMRQRLLDAGGGTGSKTNAVAVLVILCGLAGVGAYFTGHATEVAPVVGTILTLLLSASTTTMTVAAEKLPEGTKAELIANKQREP